jgi:hypothetical protein
VLIAAIVLFVLAVALAGVAVAGFTEHLPRNRWAGVRTPDTLRDDETFALANRVAAPTLLAGAAMLVLGGLGALALGGVVGGVIAAGGVVAAAVTAAAGGSLGARAAASVPALEVGGCGNSCGACALKDACAPS